MTALAWIAFGLLILTVAIVLVFRASHWPGALTTRLLFNLGGLWLAARLKRHVPEGTISELDLRYDEVDPAARLDIHKPQGTAAGADLPVLVWIHGGGFVSGDKSHVAPFLKIFAAEGVLAVGINYALAPENRYPASLADIDTALAWIVAHAGARGGDPSRIVLAGDSAGAQLAAQYAAAVTDATYAAQLGQTPALKAGALRGVLLYCGFLDVVSLIGQRGFGGMFVRTLVRAYLGTLDPRDPPLANYATVHSVSAAFPPSFITVGNGDPLDPQSRALSAKLKSLGVEAETLFYPSDHRPRLLHEYQYDFDGADGPRAFAKALAFLKAKTGVKASTLSDIAHAVR
jgi:acetyl esterase/lipase